MTKITTLFRERSLITRVRETVEFRNVENDAMVTRVGEKLAAQQAIVESVKNGIKRPRTGLEILLEQRLEEAGFSEIH